MTKAQQNKKSDLSSVEEVIYSMLVENTGAHMLDSGGAYGRNHEHNRQKTLQDFKNEPEIKYEVDDFYQDWKNKKGKRYTVNYTISVFHYLTSALTLDALCNEFNALPCKKFDSDRDVYDIYGLSDEQEAWLDVMTEKHETDLTEAKAWNSYNGEDALSQTLQGTCCEIDGDYYVFLQIHGGCDVRGGYTDPKMFKIINKDYGFAMLPLQDVDGEIDGKPVSNRDSFPRLTWEDLDTGCSAGDIELKRKPKSVTLSLYTGY